MSARFTCPRCGRTSTHPADLAGYCAACHDWTAPPAGLNPPPAPWVDNGDGAWSIPRSAAPSGGRSTTVEDYATRIRQVEGLAADITDPARRAVVEQMLQGLRKSHDARRSPRPRHLRAVSDEDSGDPEPPPAAPGLS